MEMLKEITDLFGKYGIDVMLIVAIVFLTFVFKTFDAKNRFKAGYVIFPLLSSIIVVGLSGWLSSKYIDPVKILVYGGLSAWVYDLYSAAKRARMNKKGG